MACGHPGPQHGSGSCNSIVKSSACNVYPNKLAPNFPDDAHQPSLAFVPYLVTGDYYYLEELHFWANWNMILAKPDLRQFDKGLLGWSQVRAQAWSLRTLGHAAFITPDDHPLKSYFVTRVENNINHYTMYYDV